MQVAVIGLDPDVVRFKQFGILTLLALNNTFPAIDTPAVIVTVDLNAGEEENVIEVTEPISLPSIALVRVALIAE